MKLKPDAWQTLYLVNASEVPAIAFFTEHVPTEFESTAHYFKDAQGQDVEPLAELLSHEGEEDNRSDAPYGAAIGAAIIINFITLVGVAFMVPVIARVAKSFHDTFTVIVFGFAAGAMLACAFFLLLFEATHLIAEGWTKEVDVLWRWGAMILAGFMLPAAIHISLAGYSLVVPEVQDSQDQEMEQTERKPEIKTSRARVIGSVLIGDFMHNLCDGFFLGAAFKGCGSDFGWRVAMATILHEIPQELADYILLTGPDVALSPVQALVANFISGLSVLIGATIILASDVSNAGIGLMLAFAGGVYLHVGAVDCMPALYNSKLRAPQRIAGAAAFLVGAVLIGLILLDHEHCAPEGTDGHAHH